MKGGKEIQGTLSYAHQTNTRVGWAWLREHWRAERTALLEGLRNRFSFEPSRCGYLANKFNFDIFGAASTRGRSGEDKTKLAIGGG